MPSLKVLFTTMCLQTAQIQIRSPEMVYKMSEKHLQCPSFCFPVSYCHHQSLYSQPFSEVVSAVYSSYAEWHSDGFVLKTETQMKIKLLKQDFFICFVQDDIFKLVLRCYYDISFEQKFLCFQYIQLLNMNISTYMYFYVQFNSHTFPSFFK